ncbi:hypothetical protein ACQPZG_07800 [Streptomyces sp. CA-294286]
MKNELAELNSLSVESFELEAVPAELVPDSLHSNCVFCFCHCNQVPDKK